MGFSQKKGALHVYLCDGHWGAAGASNVMSALLKLTDFPKTKAAAIAVVRKIEKDLHQQFGHPKMDENKDFTPETSLLAVELTNGKLTIFSYGDCRLMISRHGKIIYRHAVKKTWLGVFSFLGLRKRLSSYKATQFKKIACQKGDLIWLFTDGIDECHYEKSTISFAWLAKTGRATKNLKTVANKVLREVENFGAEDNASLAILRST